jgi:predicted ArsR family transcriptional regulator
MILSRLNTYLQEQHRASIADMALHLDSSPAALEGMLDKLERKGRVRKLPAGATCGKSCGKCDPTTVVVYEWIERAAL